jgi:hypothetical protein
MDTKDRFPLLRKILGTLGLPAEAIEDIIERILDWLSTKDQPTTGAPAYPFRLRDVCIHSANPCGEAEWIHSAGT